MHKASARTLPLAPARPPFDAVLAEHGIPELRRGALTTLQVNVGKLCNLACHHCHVEAGPKRTESMAARVAERVLELLAGTPQIACLDLTGGAPELNPNFPMLVREARRLGRSVIDRCNLTVLFEPGMQELPQLLAENGVKVVASLPCYLGQNVDQQRGRGVFDKSVRALDALNAWGYGTSPGLELDLVYNPRGATLPPPQAALEASYRQELRSRYGIEFNRLLTLTNMPIHRFAHELVRSGRHDEYMSLLVNHFNPGTVPGLMCRSLVSVSWDGRLYDCDFNQMLELDLGACHGRTGCTLWEIHSLSELEGRRIATESHCFGCTAGAGSSCSGALQ
ncbi:MAG: arsenosugar biosynthesis radical SAM protein ArsS [Myxococcales bacterium]|nr:arsenosugar biosynthesis radical SAM protein ArsS [Myxococcales bacterium]